MKLKWLPVVAIGLGSLLSGAASALVIDTLNDPTEFAFSISVGDGQVLAASGTVTVVSGFNSPFLTLHVNLTNTAAFTGSPLPAVLLAGWGSVGVDDNAAGMSFWEVSGGAVNNASLGNVAALTTNGGFRAGNGYAFDLIVPGHWANSVTLDVRFQSAGIFVEAAAVPEPQTLALVGLGLLGIVAIGRRKQMRVSGSASQDGSRSPLNAR